MPNKPVHVPKICVRSKRNDGDPQIKAQDTPSTSQVAKRRTMAEVPKADIIVTNPTHSLRSH
jgi:flagellar biosynthesis protein FlhB